VILLYNFFSQNQYPKEFSLVKKTKIIIKFFYDNNLKEINDVQIIINQILPLIDELETIPIRISSRLS
jgi:hypothetical protein